MKKLVIAFVTVFMCQAAFAQTKEVKKEAAKEDYVQPREKTKYASLPEKAISLELAGRGGLYSLNFDSMVSDNIALGAGVSFISVTATSSSSSASVSLTLIPVYGNYYFSDSNHRLFVTAGLDFVIGSVSFNSFGATGAGAIFVGGGGYEYRGDGGFLFRIAPYIFAGNGGVVFTGGLGLGYAF